MSVEHYDVFTGVNDVRSRPPTTQAERVTTKFGGAAKVAKLLGLNRITVYRWNYPTHRGGTGGLVPADKLKRLIDMARMQGVFLSDDDVSPREQKRPWSLPNT